MKQKLRLLFVFSGMLLFIACKSTDDKINDFVTSYNNAAASMSNNTITHTSAKAVSKTEIRILFKTLADGNETNKIFYTKALPSMVSEIFTAERSISDLTDEGVKLHFVLLASDDSELASIIVDKKKLAGLQALKSKETVVPGQQNLSPQLQQILKILNTSLPITDKEAGTKITEITVDEKMALVYNIEVIDSLAKNMKDPGTAAYLKEALLRDLSVKKMLPGLRQYGISSITYKYRNTKGEIINETSVTANELK
jgi:hypothetical protein